MTSPDRHAEVPRDGFRTMFDQAGEPLLVLRPEDGVILEANQRACSVFGCEHAHLVGCPVAQVWPDLARDDAKLGELLGCEALTRALMTLTLADEAQRTIEVTASPLRHEESTAVLAILHDVTQAQREAQVVASSRDEAERVSRQKSEYLASLSHEIRTPLNAIVGVTDLLLETQLGPEQHEYLRTIIASSNILLRLANDLVDFARIEADQLALVVRPFELRQVVDAVLDLVRAQAKERRLRVWVRYPGEMPGPLLGDAARLQQVLLNLVTNAIKNTDQGSVGIEAECAELQGEPATVGLRLRVLDTGRGIPPSLHASIFDRFVTAGEGARDGIGLGLAISSALARLMDGRLWLERSEPGTGSSFCLDVELPLADKEVELMPPEGLLEHVDLARRRARLLLAEDCPQSRQVMARLLRQAGHEVDEAEDGAAAVSMAAAHQYDLVLLDLEMPELDGIGACTQLRSDERAAGREPVPVLALSAHTEEQSKQRCLEVGMSAYLTKPVRRHRLLAAVQQWHRRRPVVLVVVGLPEERATLVAQLGRGQRYTVLAASSGEDALSLVEERAVDIAVLDMEMRPLSGYATALALRRVHGQALKLLGLVGTGEASTYHDSGCDRLLTRPILGRELLECVANLLSQSTAQSSLGPIEVVVEPGVETLAQEYLASRRREVHDVAMLLRSDDFEAVRRIAHRLKGSAGTFGFDAMSSIGAEMVQAAEALDRERTERCRARLQQYLERVVLRVQPGS